MIEAITGSGIGQVAQERSSVFANEVVQFRFDNYSQVARDAAGYRQRILGWGLRWAIERAAGHTYIWQWGDNGGYKNFVLAEPSSGEAIFVFTNGDSGARVYDRVVTKATGQDHPALFWL